MRIRIFLFLSFFSLFYSWTTNLTMEQWSYIRNIMKHPKTTVNMREKINDILFEKYQSWAIHKAYVFKRFHRQKCRNIQVQDLITSEYPFINLNR